MQKSRERLYLSLTHRDDEVVCYDQASHQKWIRKMESMGLPGKKVYDEAKRPAEKYKN